MSDNQEYDESERVEEARRRDEYEEFLAWRDRKSAASKDSPEPTVTKSTTVREDTTSERPSHGLLKLLGAIVAIAAIAVMFCLAYQSGKNNGNSNTAQPKPTPTSTSALPQTAAPNMACTSGLSVTYLDPHQGQDVGKGVDPNAPDDQKKKQILDESADPSVFAAIYNDSVFVKALHQPTITDPWSLVDKPHTLGACWTAEGKALHDKWAVAWSLTDAQPVPLLATGSNGHVGADGKPGQSVGSIPSGHATKYTYRDADGKPVSDSTLRDECLNPINSAPVAGVPVVETPPPPPTEETQPPCDTCCSGCDTTTTTPSTSTTETTPSTSTTTTTPSTSTTPSTTTTPPNWGKISTPNQSAPPGIEQRTLNPRDTLDPTLPTLAPGTSRQTTVVPPAAPPSHLNVTPRSSAPPPPPSNLPHSSTAPTHTVISSAPPRH